MSDKPLTDVPMTKIIPAQHEENKIKRAQKQEKGVDVDDDDEMLKELYHPNKRVTFQLPEGQAQVTPNPPQQEETEEDTSVK